MVAFSSPQRARLPAPPNSPHAPGSHAPPARYHERLLDPHVGDKVEVAWRGKFRLEALDIYQGLAWWVARVVDKAEGYRYKVGGACGVCACVSAATTNGVVIL